MGKDVSYGIYMVSLPMDFSSDDAEPCCITEKKLLLFKSEGLRPKLDIYLWCLRYFHFHFHFIFARNSTVGHNEEESTFNKNSQINPKSTSAIVLSV